MLTWNFKNNVVPSPAAYTASYKLVKLENDDCYNKLKIILIKIKF